MGKNETRRKKPTRLFVLELLYGVAVCLVTSPITGRSPAREEAEHDFVLSCMRAGEDEDDLLVDILDEGLRWAGPGRGVGLLVG